MLALLVAPPLSVDEVLKAVKGVNWRRLGEELIGEELEGLGVDDAYTNLDRIRDTHDSDEARLRAVVEEFLTGTDGISWRCPPTWRKVIWALYCAEDINKAQHFRSYAAPLQGMLRGIARIFIRGMFS